MRIVASILFLFFSLTLFCQYGIWKLQDDQQINAQRGSKSIHADQYTAWSLDDIGSRDLLIGASRGAKELQIPQPDGSTRTYVIQPNQVMPAELQERYPHIRTYSGYEKGRPERKVVLDYTAQGFHAMIKGEGPTIYIDPYFTDRTDYYTSYFKKDLSGLLSMGDRPLLSC